MEVGASRLACFKIVGESQGFALHPGESAGGFTLKDVDAKNGWALFEHGTNQIKARLVSYCISTPQPAASAPSPMERHPRLWTVPSGATIAMQEDGVSIPGAPLDAAGGSPAPNNATPLWINPYANRPSDASSRNVQPMLPGDTTAPSRIPQPAVAAPPSQASQTIATAPPSPSYAAPGANVSDGGSQTTGAPGSSDSPTDPATPRCGPADARTLQGEQIRAFYGTDAFLAWDIAQGPRS
jgi:hypothetical protein